MSAEQNKILEYLNQMSINVFRTEENEYHLPHLNSIDGVFDAKVIVLDDIVTISICAQIKPSAIMILLGELSQLNQNTLFIKIYFNINDESSPKIVFSYSMGMTDDLSFEQFNLIFSAVEDESLQIIGELNSSELLNNNDLFQDKHLISYSHVIH